MTCRYPVTNLASGLATVVLTQQTAPAANGGTLRSVQKRLSVKVLRAGRRRYASKEVAVSFECRVCGANHPTHSHPLPSLAREFEAQRLQQRFARQEPRP